SPAARATRWLVERQAIGTPDRHGKGAPSGYWVRLVPVANRRVPRASRSALTSDGAARVGGTCLPTGASRGGTQTRFLKRRDGSGGRGARLSFWRRRTRRKATVSERLPPIVQVID